MMGLDSCFTSVMEECLEAFVPEVFDHAVTVSCILTVVKSTIVL